MVRGKSLRLHFRLFTDCLGLKLGPDIRILVDSGLPPEFKSDGIDSCLFLSFVVSCLIFVHYFAVMSKRINLKKLDEKVERAKGESSVKAR